MKLQKVFFLVLGLAFLVSLGSLISGGNNQKAQVLDAANSVAVTSPAPNTTVAQNQVIPMTCNVKAAPGMLIWQLKYSWFQNNGAQLGDFTVDQSGLPTLSNPLPAGNYTKNVTIPNIEPGTNFKLQCVAYYYDTLTQATVPGSATNSVTMNFVSGSQAPIVAGCMDSSATNYNPNATVSDGSCVYPPPTPDTAIPTVPTGLSITNNKSHSLTLNWSASTDNIAVVGYKIYRNNGGSTTINTTTPIATVNSPTLNFTNTGLLSSRSYKYRIRAFDAAGNQSALSTTVTGSTTSVAMPTGVTVGQATTSTLTVSWTAPTTGEIFDYAIYSNNGGSTSINTTTPIAVVPFGTNTFTRTNLNANTTYRFRVAARDQAANRSTLTTAISGTTLTATTPAPATPSITSVTSGSPSQSVLTVNWNTVSGLGYKVFRSSTQNGTYSQVSGTSLITANNFSNTGLNASTTYWYKIQACYTATPTNCSAQSVAVSGTTAPTPDTTAPTPVPVITVGTTTQNEISVSWSTSTDTTSPVTYRLERAVVSSGGAVGAFSQVYSGPNTSFSNTGLTSGATYQFRVRACDAVSPTPNCTALSTVKSGTTLSLPVAPTGVSVGSPTTSSLTVSWNTVAGATSYKVYRMTSSGAVDATVPTLDVSAPNTTLNVTGLASGTTYYFAVSSFNSVGESARSATASGVTSTPQVTISSINLVTANGATVIEPLTGGETINIGNQNGGVGQNISIIVNTNPAVAGSVVFSLTKPNGQVHSQTENAGPYAMFGDTAPTTLGPWQDLQIGGYTLTVTPYAGSNATGQVGVPQTIQFQVVNNDDITPPANPTNIVVTYRSANQIRLSWTNSTSSDVASYRVYRNDVSVGVVNHPTNTFTDTTVNGTTSYNYKVAAVDTSGNEAALPVSGTGTPTLSTQFSVNNQVQTNSSTNVKTTPESTTNAGTQPVGVNGVITNGPVWVTGGVQHWYVDFTSGTDGWVNQNNIDIFTPPTDTTAPTVNITAPTNNQVFPVGTTTVNLNVTTNENATCRWSANNVSHGSMTETFTGAGTTSHTYPLLGLTNGTSYTRYVSCIDATGNASAPSVRAFSVAADVVTPPPVNDPVVNTTCATGTTLPSNTGTNRSVALCAAINETVPSITLNWSPVSGRSVTSITVSRKVGLTSTSWTQVATPAASSASWTDTNVTPGQYYEYRVVMNTSGGSATGYIASGIKLAQPEYRGRLVLVIDNTFQTSLATQINQLIDDLNADKWIVSPIYVSRTATPASVRSSIQAIYNSDPTNTKAVYLLGHVPVATSGNVNPDEHVGRRMSSDSFYGEMTSTWTSVSGGCTTAPVNPVGQDTGVSTGLDTPSNDSIYCLSNPPSDVELQVGRVDFYEVNVFGQTEQTMLANYLTKARNFKIRQTVPVERAYIRDRFSNNGYPMGRSAWSNIPSIVGVQNVTSDIALSPTLQTILNNQSYLFVYGNYFGASTRASASAASGDGGVIGSATAAASTNWGGVFNFLIGSYFGEWNDENSYLKSLLGSGNALANVYAGKNYWYFHHMGMGQNIGHSARLAMNNASLYTPLGGITNDSTTGRNYMALLGDPTLRAFYVGRPSNLNITNNGGQASFSWTASTDSPLGYNIYEIQTNSIRKVNSSIISGTSFASTDTFTSGRKYMVTAVKVKSTAGGTFYNESLGVISTVGGTTTPPPVTDTTAPTAPTALTVSNSTSSSITFTWTASTDNVGVTEYRISRSSTQTGTYTQVGTSTTTSFQNTGLSAGTTYWYRVTAVDAAGNVSAASTAVSFATSSGSQQASVMGINGPVGPNTTTNISSVGTNPYGGTDYFVSCTGNDSNNGTSMSTPWATISKVNTMTSSQRPGMRIFFKRGCTFRGTLNFYNGGTNTAPVIVDAYGEGSAPVISGNTLVTGWTQHSGNIWRATVSAPATAPKYLFIGGQYQTMARQPNTGFYFTTSRSGTTISDTDNTWLSSQSANSLAGAQFVERASPWSYSVGNITANSGTTLTGTDIAGGNIKYGNSWTTKQWGYLLRNKLSFLDTAGEWYFDSATNTVYLWAPSNANPNNLTVEMTSLAQGIYFGSSATNVTVRNLVVEGQNTYAVQISQSKRITIENLDIRNAYSGIYQYGTSGNPVADRNVFRNNHIRDLNIYGITLFGGDGHLIEGNLIERISLVPDRIFSSSMTHIGIATPGTTTNASTIRNIVRDIGWSGLAVSGSGAVTENLVERTMRTLTDGGGITFDSTDGLLINKNIVKDVGVGSGATAGTGGSPNMESQPLLYESYSAKDKGIYFGDGSAGGTTPVAIRNTTIENNVIINSTDGVWIDHGLGFENNRVINNIVYSFNRAGIGFSDYSNYRFFPSIDCNVSRSNSPCYIGQYSDVVTGNKIYGVASHQNPLYLLQVYSNGTGAVADFGTIDNNYYSNPYRTTKVNQYKDFNGQNNNWTLAQWQANSNEDDNSTAPNYTATQPAQIFYNATTSPITQSVNGCSSTGTPLTGNQTIQPFSALVVEYGNC